MESDDGALKVLDELTEDSPLLEDHWARSRESPDSELSHQLLELSRAQGVASYLMLLFLFKKQDQLELKMKPSRFLLSSSSASLFDAASPIRLPHVT